MIIKYIRRMPGIHKASSVFPWCSTSIRKIIGFGLQKFFCGLIFIIVCQNFNDRNDKRYSQGSKQNNIKHKKFSNKFNLSLTFLNLIVDPVFSNPRILMITDQTYTL